jgi:hypothetical protein
MDAVNGKRARSGARTPEQKCPAVSETAPGEAATTVVFDSEDEYVRFTDYVFEKFGGRGLELTDVPIVASIRVKPWLLEQVHGRFVMHPAMEAEVEAARQALRDRGHTPFDPANLADFRVPGVSPAKRSS